MREQLLIKHKYFALGILLLLGFIVRLYKITNPVLDWHAFRQADTASVTRQYVKNGIDLLHPTYQDHSNIASGKDNPVGYRMVEFPVINAATALILRAFPALDLEIFSRLISVLLSLVTLSTLFFLVRSLSGIKAAVLSSLAFALLPYSIYYSRVVLPEPAMLAFSSSSLLFFHLWLKHKLNHWYWLSILTLSLALLLKPFVVFLGPVYIALIYYQNGLAGFKKITLIPFVILAFAPILAWRNWITNFPEGIPASDWLYNGDGIRLRPAWFRWLFYERLTKLILGFFGIFLLPLALLSKNKDKLVYAAWWLGVLAYLVVFATGNVRHDYYQVLLIPIICITLAKGSLVAAKILARYIKPTLAYLLVGLIFTATLITPWKYIKGYFNVNHWEYKRAGKEVDALTPPDAKVIARAFGDTMFLFQTNRTGWPIGFEIDDKINKGATHYISTSYDDEARELEAKFKTIKKTDEYLLLDLGKQK